MSRSRNPGEGQEPMIVQAADQQVAAAAALPLTPEVAVTDRLEQLGHLSAVVHGFDVVADQSEWLRSARSPTSALHQKLYKDYDKKGDDIITGRQKQMEATAANAKNEFYQAIGRNVLVDAGLLSPTEADALANQEYAQFEKLYRGLILIRRERRARFMEHLEGLMQGLTGSTPPPAPANVAPDGMIPRPNLAAKTALARMLKPEFQGLRVSDYAELTTNTLDKYQPTALRQFLVRVGSRSPNAASYVRDGDKHLTYVVVSPSVRKITRSVTQLAESAVNGSESLQNRLTGEILDTDRPRRAGIHVVEERQEILQKYRTCIIDRSLAVIEQFEEALKYDAGLARFGDEGKARQRLTELQLTTFDEMLWSAGVNAKLDTADRSTMRRSVEKTIYFAPDSKSRRENFANYLAVAKEWRVAQGELFDSLLATCAHYIDSHQPND